MEEIVDDKKREREVKPSPTIERTPQWLVDYVNEDFEISFYPQLVEGANPLDLPWRGLTFVHPPHAEAQLYCQKAAEEAEKGVKSVLLLPAVFNGVYWRTIVYPKAAHIRIFTCPIKMPGAKKQIVSQMCLVYWDKKEREEEKSLYPPIYPVEPEGWEAQYYKRARNRATFSIRK